MSVSFRSWALTLLCVCTLTAVRLCPRSDLCNNNVKMKGTVRSSLENFAQSDVFLRSATHEHERWLVLATALLHLAGHNVLSEVRRARARSMGCVFARFFRPYWVHSRRALSR
jgi:hypothetical protein